MPSSTHTATPKWLTAEQVALQLQVSPRAIRDWATEGLIEYTRLGSAARSPMRFTQQAIDDYLASRTTAARPQARGRRAS